MTLTPTIVDQWSDGKRLFVVGTVAITGNYTQFTGDPLSFAGTSIQSMQKPTDIDMWPSQSGYTFGYTPGTTRDNGFFRVWQAFNTELATNPYPAALTGDTNIQFMATFRWGV